MELAAAAARRAGFEGEPLVIAVAVGQSESGCIPTRVGDQKLVDEKWGPSVGIWQVRSLHAHKGTGLERDEDRLTDPDFNARSAFTISKQGTDFSPWTDFRNGKYLAHMDAARRVVGLPAPKENPMKLVRRAEWGARNPSNVVALNVRMVTVHWVGPGMGTPNHDDCGDAVRGIQRYHMDSNGWADVAYNALVCPHGYVFEGRGKGRRSAANGDSQSNSASYAICYLGGEGDPFTAEAKDAINDAAEWLVPGKAEWRRHRDWTSTSCPGDEIASWVTNGHPRASEAQEPEPVEPEVFVPGTSVLASVGSGLVVDVEAQSTENTARVLQWPLNGQKNQLVRLEPVGDKGAVLIRFAHSDKVLDGDPLTEVVHQYERVEGAKNQEWMPMVVRGNIRVFRNEYDQKVLDVTALSTNPGAALQRYAYTGGDNQLFVVIGL